MRREAWAIVLAAFTLAPLIGWFIGTTAATILKHL